MAKREPYSISPNDPDIVLFKEKFPEIYEMMLDATFNSFPGIEDDTWNSINELTWGDFCQYIDHCIEHYEFLLGRWSEPNKEKITNFMLTLCAADFRRSNVVKNIFLRIDGLCCMPSDPTKAMNVFGFFFHQEAPIPAENFNSWVMAVLNAFIEISNACESEDLFNILIDTGSQSFVKKHHFLASQAAFFASLAYKYEEKKAGAGRIFLPLTYKMLQQAIIWQQEDKADLKSEGGPVPKRRLLYSPDSFQFKEVSDGQNSQLFRSLTRDFFIKAWLFRFIEINSTSKSLSKQELLSEMSKRIPGCAGMPNKTLENLLVNLRQPGYVSSRLKRLLK